MRFPALLTPLLIFGLLAFFYAAPTSAELDPSWKDTDLTTSWVSPLSLIGFVTDKS
jgi:hypothetical protein